MTLLVFALGFYIGGFVSMFQTCSIAERDDGTRLRVLTRLFAAFTWPVTAIIWDRWQKGDEDGQP